MADDKISVGLMGFGRIGRNVFRQLQDHPRIETAAIVDVAEPKALVYLLKFDTIHGRFPKPVRLADSTLYVEDQPIPILPDREPGEADWGALGVEVVVQATGKYRSAEWCRRHLEAGAKRVILCSTPEDPNDMDTLLVGVNDHVLDPRDVMVALGSNTSNALAPVLKILDESFRVERAMFTTVHAFTNEQRLADVPGSDLRSSRSAAENIIPMETNSPEIIENVLPQFKGKISGMALNVPVPDGSSVDLVTILGKEATTESVNKTVQSAAASGYSTILEYVEDPIVSSDVIGNPHSAIFDGLATLVMDRAMVKTVIWFDNGWGYAARAVEVVERLAAFDREGVST
ncbi:MAG: type I glyceraldehyde-3-phosphate dehydrogenase [Acidimicrobiia bacterium]